MPMESSEKKHAYAGRQCMACGGKACNISYEALRDMVEKKQNGDFMAKGGTVEETRHPMGGSSSRSKAAANWRHEGKQEGVHRSGDVHTPGESGMGRSVRAGDYSSAKKMHYQQRKESLNVPKPHGHYADGGEVSTQPSPPPPKVDKDGYDNMGNKVHKDTSVIDGVNHALGNYADGGDVDAEGDDSEMLDHCVGECMEAMKSGDKAAFKDAMYVMMADMMRKMGKED